jgi:ribosomal protein L7/L12
MSQLQLNQSHAQSEFDRVTSQVRITLDNVNEDVELANRIKAAMEDVYGDLLAAVTHRSNDADAVLQHIDPTFYTQLRDVSCSGARKIDGIKAIRNRFGYGLGDSKMFFEALRFNIY